MQPSPKPGFCAEQSPRASTEDDGEWPRHQLSHIPPRSHNSSPDVHISGHVSPTRLENATQAASVQHYEAEAVSLASNKRHNHGASSNLLALPVEIRLQILRKLLRLPTMSHQTPYPQAKAPAKRRTSSHPVNPACVECDALRQVRDQVDGPSVLFPEVLRACRLLYDDGLGVLVENPFIALFTAVKISEMDVKSFNLTIRDHRQECQSSVAPVMTIWIQDTISGSPMHLYLVELRDIFHLVRYLLRYARRKLGAGSINIYAHRFFVPGTCTLGTAARTLFVDSIHPYLNGDIFNVGAYDSSEISHTRQPLTLIETLLRIPKGTDPAVRDEFNNGVRSCNSYYELLRTGQRWDHNHALQIWKSARNDLYQLASKGGWHSSESWELVAHRSICTIADQIHYQDYSRLPREVKKELLKVLEQLRFLVLVIHANFSYLPSSPVVSLDSNQHNYGSRSRIEHIRWAKDYVWTLTRSSPDWLGRGADNSYMWLMYIEMSARSAKYPKAMSRSWRALYHFLRLFWNGEATLNQWVKGMMRWARRRSRDFIESESEPGRKGEQLWKEEGSFRGYFFRGLMKEMMVPLVIEKYGKEDGIFFRDAVTPSLEKWVVEGLGMKDW